LDPNGLQNNGGSTQAVSVDCSSAIDAGIFNAQVSSTDQRGEVRIGMPDIGAYENGSIVDPIINMAGLALVSNYNASYQWIDCNNGNMPILGATYQIYSPVANESYAVIVGDGSGCVDTSACHDVNNVGIEELSLSNNLKVIPNPNVGLFKIELGKLYSRVRIVIVDVSGKKILERFIENSSEVAFELNDLNGLFFIEIQTESDNATIPVIVQ